MFHSRQRVGSAVVLVLPGMVALASGTGCPQAYAPINYYTNPPSISVSIASSNNLDAGASGSAAATVSGATGNLTYQWSITSPGAIVGSSTDAVVNFTLASAGTALLLVTVTDSGTGTNASAGQEIASITPSPGTPLIVDAGADQTVAVGGTVLLFGSATGGSGQAFGAYDFEWRQASGPFQKTSPDFVTSSPAITVIGTTAGTAVFELIVRDSTGDIASDTVSINVVNPPG